MNNQAKQSRASTDKRKVQEGDKRWLDNVCAELFWRVGEKAVAKMLMEKLDHIYRCDGFEKRIARLERKAKEIRDEEAMEGILELLAKIIEDRVRVDEIRSEIDEKYRKIERVFSDLEENLSSLEKMLIPEKPFLGSFLGGSE